MPPTFERRGKYPDFIDLTSPTPSPTRNPEGARVNQTSEIASPKPKAVPALSQKLAQTSTSDLIARDAARITSSQKSFQPLYSSAQSRANIVSIPDVGDFGASIAKPKNSTASSSRAAPGTPTSKSYSGYIKPATPGAFTATNDARAKNNFIQPRSSDPPGYVNGWPAYLAKKPTPPLAPVQPPKAPEEEEGEHFDIDKVQLTAEDYTRVDGDAEKHMRRLLEGAVGDGEDDGVEDGQDTVEGFSEGVRLMPHQVRGVAWMRKRESARNRGGILADDMGLGKTVQTLARIVEGRRTDAEKRAGYKGTLIVAPLAVMEQWATEVRTKTKPGCLSVTTHHGPSRAKSGKKLEDFDVVITTFQTLASENLSFQASVNPPSGDDSEPEIGSKTLKKKPKGRQAAMYALFQIKWTRVVIDEAQNIKNRSTNAAKAALTLNAKYRWCLTGTPIQNSVDELHSLFEFLRARPLDDRKVFKERITSQVKDGRTGIAMKRLHVVLKAIMLRRTKDATIDGKPILKLPGRTVEIVNCPFDTEEREFYDALEKSTQLTVNKFLRSGTAMANYTSVLTLLLRLRQACDHPSLVTKPVEADKEAIDNKAAEGKDDEPDQADELADMLGGLGVSSAKSCELCFRKLEAGVEKYCTECEDIARKARQMTEGDDGLPPTSAKIRMLIKILQDVDARSLSKEKTIVFSQFTSFLNLIEPFLAEKGIRFVRYDGSMRNDKRQASLETIKSSSSVRVILISFKAGSTGLNLTCCNNVVLMDMWWNPALEDQAFDRAHRLGQKLDVNIYKLAIEETVEDRILKLQEAKRELAKAALSGEGVKNMKMTMTELMALFRH